MMPDNYDLFLRHDAEREKEILRLPECAECGEHIQDDYCYETSGYLICEECLKDNHRKNTDDFIR